MDPAATCSWPVAPSSGRSCGWIPKVACLDRGKTDAARLVCHRPRAPHTPQLFRDREAGASKMSLPIAFEALLLVPRLRREVRRGLAPPASAATAADPVPAAPADEEMASSSEPSG